MTIIAKRRSFLVDFIFTCFLFSFLFLLGGCLIKFFVFFFFFSPS